MDDVKTGDQLGLSSSTQFNKTYETTRAGVTTGSASRGLSGTTNPSASTVPYATIGSKIQIKGELVGEEDIIIQGHIEGTVNLKNNNLTVGKAGRIRADVVAKNIIVEGDVEGDLYGKERVVVRKTSNVRGNIVASRVSLEDGAKFRGSIDMDIEAKRPIFQKNETENNAEAAIDIEKSHSLGDEKNISDESVEQRKERYLSKSNQKPKAKQPA